MPDLPEYILPPFPSTASGAVADLERQLYLCHLGELEAGHAKFQSESLAFYSPQIIFLLTVIAITLAMLFGAYSWRLVILAKNQRSIW